MNQLRLRVRPVTIADLPQILDLVLAAMNDGPDELFAYNHPHSKEFKADNEFYWTLQLRTRFNVPDSINLVAETCDLDQGDQVAGEKWTIRGWAMYILHSASGRKLYDEGFEDSWAMALGRTWLKVYQAVTKTHMFSPKRRDINHAHYSAFLATVGRIEDKYWSADSAYPENIELSTLYVSPESQRQGVGSELVKWGLQVAEQKGIVVGVQAQEKPRPFYQRLGFKMLDTVKIRSAEDDESVA